MLALCWLNCHHPSPRDCARQHCRLPRRVNRSAASCISHFHSTDTLVAIGSFTAKATLG